LEDLNESPQHKVSCKSVQ